MNMEGEGNCVYMFRYTYTAIREMKMQTEKKDRHDYNHFMNWVSMLRDQLFGGQRFCWF